MNINHQYLPPEVVETIVNFASHFTNKRGRLDSKRTLLDCALVCKTWLWPARRRLQSLHLNLERVSIISTRILTFSDIFGSPLCTFDSDLIQTLTIHPNHNTRHGDLVPVLRLLSALERISLALPSLHTLSFCDTNLNFSDNGHNDASDSPDDSTTATVRSKIKTLKFQNVQGSESLDSVVQAASLFPSLETLKAKRASWDRRHNKKLLSFRPPPSLRRLDVDTLTFVSVMEWLVAFKYDFTPIVSVSIDESLSQHKDQLITDHLPRDLGLLGSNLQECELCTPLTL